MPALYRLRWVGDEPFIGSSSYACRCGLDSPTRLEPCLADFRLGEPSHPYRAAEQVMVHLLAADPTRAPDYVRARDYVNRPRGLVFSADQHAEVARFLNRWFVVARLADVTIDHPAAVADAQALADHPQHARAVAVARRWCHDILRCIEVPSAEELAAATRDLEALLRARWGAAPAPIREFIARALVPPALDAAG